MGSLLAGFQVIGSHVLKANVELWHLPLSLSRHEVDGFASLCVPTMMCCLSTGLKEVESTDYEVKPLKL